MHPKKCVDIVCYIFLQHNDHNVASSSLETHEIILKYSNLFDFDQLLISTQIGSIEENRDITHLLSLCEHGDLHFRGACANLLVTLIQTTNHLLTLSSLSNSFNNSFINQCSLVSTDSQDSSSLAQLIDDIDFRILTYLEQQQQLKQQYPDIRVRQATASTFTKNSFVFLFKENDKDSSTTSSADKDKKHFIYCIAEFLVMLSHDTLHSKQVIRIQDLIKHYDSLLASGHEPETHTLAALEPVLYDFFSCSSYANN
ncbi:unnamed protein product [Rotaria sp. Silwood1]|nr:unnamed protein product [Rotaria sp. Silwood1]CAF1666122.1 unnamed protein product [Rotaria sp. Silwood1]